MAQVTVKSPEDNLITTATLTDAQIREVDFVEKFQNNLKKLIEVLGVTRKVAAQAGTVLKTYKATGTLEDGRNIPEGQIIPLSQYTVEPKTYKEIELKKPQGFDIKHCALNNLFAVFIYHQRRIVCYRFVTNQNARCVCTHTLYIAFYLSCFIYNQSCILVGFDHLLKFRVFIKSFIDFVVMYET